MMDTFRKQIERLKLAVRAVWLGPMMSSDPAAREFFGGQPTATGISVDESTALNYSAVWAAVSLISGDLAAMPLPVYQRLRGGGKQRAVDHPLYPLLNVEPNPDMSAMVFRETLQAHIL